MATIRLANKRASQALKATQRPLRAGPRPLAVAAAVALLPWTSQVLANPTGEKTLFGIVDYARPNTQTMNINVGSASAASSFTRFSIDAGQTVNVQQLSSTSTYLIKDVGGTASQIYGTLNANGQVFMSNTSGVYFGRGAEVNVGALFATSLNINPLDFEAGRYNFYKDGAAGTVVNDGHITASAYAALAGPQVRNDGVIVARAGTVALAAGDRVTLDMVGDRLIKVSVDQSALNATAINTGSIEADGGSVLLTARSANALLDTVVNNSGVIRANSLINRNGEIILDGGSAGIVSNTGTLNASGTGAGTTGGAVKVLGQYAGLSSRSTIDASGDAGGGTVLIGGNFHGAGAEQNAAQTYIGGGASINVDAVNSGNGGQVAVWSNDGTKFYGSISARGGTQNGNGGFVEVSGKRYLDYKGITDTRAPHGRTGTLLLDPDDINIVSGLAGADLNIKCTGGGTCAVPSTGPFTDAVFFSGTAGTLTDGTLNAQLAINNVDVTATGAITSQSAVAVHTNGNTLKLNAGSAITLGGTYDGGGTLNLNFASTLDLTPTHDIKAVTANATGAGVASVIKAGGATWSLSALNTGTVSEGQGAVAFTAVGNLQDTGTGTLREANATWTISGPNAGSVTNLSGSFSGMGSLQDTTNTGTLKASNAAWTLNASNTGTVTNLSGTFSGMANLTDLGAGAFNMHGSADGSVSGNIVSTNPGSISYTGYTSATTFVLTGAANQSTGIGGIWSGLSTAVGSSNNDTIKGANQTYTITGANAGNNGAVSWTSFESITDTGSGTLKEASATWTITGSNAGTVTNLSGSFSGIANLQDTGTGTLREANATWTISGPNAGTVTSLSGSFSGMANLQDTANAGTLEASNAVWRLNASNTGTVTNLSGTFSGMANVTDLGAGTFNMHGTGNGSITGNLVSANPGSISYASYTSAAIFELSGAANQSTGIGGTWTGLTTATGSSNSDTINGTNQTYTITAPNAGNSAGVTWTSFENVTDAGTGTLRATNAIWTLNGANTGTVTKLSGAFSGIGSLTDLGAGTFNMHGTGNGSITGNLVSTNPGSISYAGYTSATTFELTGSANQSTGIVGTWGGLSTAVGSSNSDTIKGANQTYTITGANAGNSAGVSWTSFENVTDTGTGTLRATNAIWTLNGANTGTVTNLSGAFSGIGNLTDLAAGTFNMHGTGNGSITGNLASANPGSISYAGYTSAATFELSGAANQSTGIGATWIGLNTATGSSNSDTIKGTNQTYTITAANAGNRGAVSWTSFESITDAGSGTLREANATWTITALNAGTVTNLSGSFSGIANLQDTGTGTLKEANATWTISGANAGTVTNLSGSFSGMGNLQDTANTGTLRASGATWTLNSSNSGTVTNLSGTFSGMANLTDLGAGTFNMHGTGNGSITGNLVSTNPGSLRYAGYTSATTFELTGAANQSTGIGGTWSGLSTAVGSSNSDTIKGPSQTYTITAANAGNNGALSWTSFENITDTGTGTLRATNAIWTLNAANAGTVTNLSGAFSGIGNLTDLAAGTFNMHGTGNGSITGNLVSTNPGSISYAGYTSAATFDLSGAANQSTAIAGTWSGLTTATGSTNADTVKGANRTYTITGANAGNNGAVSWTSFENITDTGSGTLKEANATWTITGSNAGTVTNLSGSFSGIANLQDTGTGTLKEANATWTISGANAGSVTNLSGSFSGMGNFQDTANTGTLKASNAAWTLNASNTGTVTNLSGTFSGMANLTDLGAGTFNMHGTGNGSITGNLVSTNPGSLRYAGYTSATTFELTGATNQTTGIGGTWSGLSTAVGSSNSDTIKGANQSYTITGANAGNNGALSWTSFENITDTGTGTLRASNAIWTLNGANTGTVTNLSGAFSGIGNLSDLGAGTFNMHGTGNGSITGNLVSTNPGSISYAGYTSAATFELSGATNQSTAIAGTWSGLTAATGTTNADTVKGAGQTYTLDNSIANKASNGTVIWTSFENLTDTAGGTFNMGTAGSISGSITAVGGTVSYASRATAATFNLNGGASTGIGAWSGVTAVAGSAGSDAITGTGQTYTITATNAGNNGIVSWTSFENLTDLSTGTLQAANATWTLNGSNTGTVSNLSGSFAGMGNLTDLGTGAFNMRGTGNGSITGNLSGGANGSMNYSGYTGGVSVSLSGAPGSTTGVGGTRGAITSVTGSSNNDTITGAGTTYNLTGTNAGNSGSLSWNSFESVSDATGGTFNLFVASNNLTGTLSSGGATSLNSAVDITGLNVSVSGTLTMTGTAASWNLTGAPQPSLFQTTNADANVYFNGACIGGPACGTVIAIVGSIGSSVSQIAAQALKDAQSTDSVAKQIDYGFAGDVGTTPPMDHRIDETGISTPECFEESRENQACKAN